MDTPTDTPLEPQPAPSSWLARARAALTTARDRLTTWWGRVREASPLPSWVVALFVLLLVILFVAMRTAPPAPAPAAEQPAAVQVNPLAELVTRLDELDAMVADLQDQVAELQDPQQPAAAPRRSAAPRPAAMGPTPAGQPPQSGAAWSTPTDLDRALTKFSKTLQEPSK